jgi:large subunit ribosomal protein L4
VSTETASVSVPVVSQSRAAAGQIEVPSAVLAGPVNEGLLHAMVTSQRASRRAGTHMTKTKGLVSGGGKKPWKQKGTGRARAGSSRSPIWAGGGTIFGPQPRSYAYQLPKSARKAALRSALAARHGEGKLVVVDALKLAEPKTKLMVEALAGLGVEGSALVVTATPDESLLRASRNLAKVRVLPLGGLNVYDILKHHTLVITREALEQLVARLSSEEAAA